jgi:streptogramin lyase
MQSLSEFADKNERRRRDMHVILLGVAAIAVTACVGSSNAAAQAHTAATMKTPRPGANAPNCITLTETADGCTFHTRKGNIERVHLPTAAGVTWTATMGDTALVSIGEAKDEAMPDGSKQHVIIVAPQTAEDADVIVRFEKRNGSQLSAPVAETRSVYFMIHALAPAASH